MSRSLSSLKRASLALASTAVLVLTGVPQAAAQSQDARAQQTKLRQSTFTVLAAQISPMGAMVQGRVPFDAEAFRVAAERAAVMASIAAEMFPPNSLAQNSKAKPEIWRNQADFQRLMTDLREKTAQLATTASSGTLDSIRPAFIAASSTCKACHDKYKLD
jgi:cytochrome c556